MWHFYLTVSCHYEFEWLNSIGLTLSTIGPMKCYDILRDPVYHETFAEIYIGGLLRN